MADVAFLQYCLSSKLYNLLQIITIIELYICKILFLLRRYIVEYLTKLTCSQFKYFKASFFQADFNVALWYFI